MVVPATFPKTKRLLTSRDFMFSKSSSFVHKSVGFKLIYKTSTSPFSFSRLGLAVSSRVGGAVKRNKIKRITREEFRKSDFAESLDILFIPTKSLVVSRLSTELKKAFNCLKGI